MERFEHPTLGTFLQKMEDNWGIWCDKSKLVNFIEYDEDDKQNYKAELVNKKKVRIGSTDLEALTTVSASHGQFKEYIYRIVPV